MAFHMLYKCDIVCKFGCIVDRIKELWRMEVRPGGAIIANSDVMKSRNAQRITRGSCIDESNNINSTSNINIDTNNIIRNTSNFDDDIIDECFYNKLFWNCPCTIQTV